MCGANVSSALLHESLHQDSQVDFFEGFISSDTAPDQRAHLHQDEVGYEGEPFHAPLLCNPYGLLRALQFLAFIFLVVAILATTYATREATSPSTTVTSITDT
jgi:hypothetical protein